MKNFIKKMIRAAVEWASDGSQPAEEDPGNSLEAFIGGEVVLFQVLRANGPTLICTNGRSEYVIRSSDAKNVALFWKIWHKVSGGSRYKATWEDGTPVDPSKLF